MVQTEQEYAMFVFPSIASPAHTELARTATSTQGLLHRVQRYALERNAGEDRPWNPLEVLPFKQWEKGDSYVYVQYKIAEAANILSLNRQLRPFYAQSVIQPEFKAESQQFREKIYQQVCYLLPHETSPRRIARNIQLGYSNLRKKDESFPSIEEYTKTYLRRKVFHG